MALATAAAPKSAAATAATAAAVADEEPPAAGGLVDIEAKDCAGDGNMLGDTDAEEAADCDILELADALPVDDACGGYCISNFIGGTT